MNYIIAHCNPENNWLSTTVNSYKKVADYISLDSSTDLLSLSGEQILADFENVVTHFVTKGAGNWIIKAIKCNQISSYDITHEEPYVEEITHEDENGDTITETISGTKIVIDKTVPILNLRITDSSNSIPNSERFYFENSRDLPSSVENSVVSIWDYFDK